MAKDLNQALSNVELTYAQLKEIADDMLTEIVSPINNLIKVIGDDVNSLSIDQLKDYMWKLQFKAYTLSEVKERSLMKAEIAEALQKEKFADKFNSADGSAAVKNNIALIETSEEIVIQVLYEMISNLLKTKVDQIHRLVDCCKSILVTRMQEAKLSIGNIE